MAEEFFQGGVCGGTWWNPNTLFCGNAGGGGGGVVGFSSPCSVAQLGGYDMGSFGWPHEVIMMKTNKFNNNDDDQNCDVDNNNNLVFSSDFDSTLDQILGFGFSPPTTTTTSTTTTSNWNQQQNQFCKGENSSAPIIQDNLSSCLTTSSNNSPGGDSRLTSFPVTHSSAAYLIQSLFDDIDNENPHTSIIPKSVSELIDPSNYGPMDHSQVISGCPWAANSTVNRSSNNNNNNDNNSNSNSGIQSLLPTSLQLPQGDYNNNVTALGDIQANLLNSMQSHNCDTLTSELKQEDGPKELNKIMNDNDQPTPKRQRIETLSSLPSFKVRKEKLGDRITALQQLVSPFGKTDTASVLHEAIEYIKFLHDQVHVLTTPYLKNGAPGQQQQKVMTNNGNDNQQDLRNRGLCLVPISSTYPVAQETPVDFWTPTFGATM